MEVSQAQVDQALKRLGHYRVVRAQEVVEGSAHVYGMMGSHLLALGLRETWGRNIRGGARWDPGRAQWVIETDPTKQDVGWLQISCKYHSKTLKMLPGVLEGTWSPLVEDKSAYDPGMVPRFTDSLRFTLSEMREAMDLGVLNNVHDAHLVRFAIAAHNAGSAGAMKGYREGDVDKYTAGGDYSAWVLAARKLVVNFLNKNPDWIWKE